MKKYIFISLFVLLGLFLGQKIIAQSQLPKVTTACETKLGVLYAINDGFSLINRCRDKDRQVVIGDQPQTGIGNIAFIDKSLVLLTNGEIWEVDESSGSPIWKKSIQKEVPIPVSQIVSWTPATFLQSNGDFWITDQIEWKNVGQPTP